GNRERLRGCRDQGDLIGDRVARRPVRKAERKGDSHGKSSFTVAIATRFAARRWIFHRAGTRCASSGNILRTWYSSYERALQSEAWADRDRGRGHRSGTKSHARADPGHGGHKRPAQGGRRAGSQRRGTFV